MITLHPEILDPEDMSLCPFCDMPIFIYEPAQIVEVLEVQCLVHANCMDDAIEEHCDD